MIGMSGRAWRWGLYTLDVDHSTLENQKAFESLIGDQEALPLVDKCGGWHGGFTTYYRKQYSNLLIDNYAPQEKYHQWLDEYVNSEQGNAFYQSFVNLTNTTLRGTYTYCQMISQTWDSNDNIDGMDSIRGALDKNLESNPEFDAVAFTRGWVFLDGLKIMREEMLVSMAIAAAMVIVICVVLLGSVYLASKPHMLTRCGLGFSKSTIVI